jgi:hypothetical protein
MIKLKSTPMQHCVPLSLTGWGLIIITMMSLTFRCTAEPSNEENSHRPKLRHML